MPAAVPGTSSRCCVCRCSMPVAPQPEWISPKRARSSPWPSTRRRSSRLSAKWPTCSPRARIWPEQLQAQQAAEKAQAERLRLADARYKAGISSYLEVLDAQRESYAAQQGTRADAARLAQRRRPALQGIGRRGGVGAVFTRPNHPRTSEFAPTACRFEKAKAYKGKYAALAGRMPYSISITHLVTVPVAWAHCLPRASENALYSSACHMS